LKLARSRIDFEVDRIRDHRPVHGAERGDRSRHVKRRAHEHPGFGGSRADQFLGEDGVLMGAARAFLHDDTCWSNPFFENETRCRTRLGKPDREQLALAADERELRLGMTSGQRNAGKHPCDRAVEHRLPIGERNPRIDRTPEHQYPVDSVRQHQRPRKPLFETQHHRGTDRHNGDYQETDRGETDQHLAASAARTDEEQNPGEQNEQQQVAGL
jgi:hypothetical protein